MTNTASAPATTAVRADALRVGMLDAEAGQRITAVRSYVRRGERTTTIAWTVEDGASYTTVSYNAVRVVVEDAPATLTARWWHPSGFWTTGTFEGATVEQVTASITRARGTHITVSPR